MLWPENTNQTVLIILNQSRSTPFNQPHRGDILVEYFFNIAIKPQRGDIWLYDIFCINISPQWGLQNE